jgi:hypothetical protein
MCEILATLCSRSAVNHDTVDLIQLIVDLLHQSTSTSTPPSLPNLCDVCAITSEPVSRDTQTSAL